MSNQTNCVECPADNREASGEHNRVHCDCSDRGQSMEWNFLHLLGWPTSSRLGECKSHTRRRRRRSGQIEPRAATSAARQKGYQVSIAAARGPHSDSALAVRARARAVPPISRLAWAPTAAAATAPLVALCGGTRANGRRRRRRSRWYPADLCELCATSGRSWRRERENGPR